MDGYVYIMLGNLLAKVAGQYAQDWYETKTEWGRNYAKRKDLREQEKRIAETEEKIKISNEEHKHKLEQMRERFKLDLEIAENKFLGSLADKQYQAFLKNCFPLRNPYDMDIMFMVKHDENKHLVATSMKTNVASYGHGVVPLRLIAAMPDQVFPMASDLKSDLSLFLVNHYSATGSHAVFSDIGSWREEVPANDASINYLYMGLQGQPTMVLVPEFFQNEEIMKIKLWSWGLGEELPFPKGIVCGMFDLSLLRNNILLEELKEYAALLKKTGLPNESIRKSQVYINTIEDKSLNLSDKERQMLLAQIEIPEELRKTGHIQRRTHDAISTVFSVMCGMFADTYHLMNYGTLPKLPSLLAYLNGVDFLLPQIRDYYIALCNTALHERILTTEMAARFELQLMEYIQQIRNDKQLLSPLKEDFDKFYINIEDRDVLKELNTQIKLLKQQ